MTQPPVKTVDTELLIDIIVRYLRLGILGGSATEQNGVQDFKISRFHWDLRISMGFQFMDFEISMGFMGFLWDYFRILRYFTEIIGINILLGISDLGFKQDFSSDFSICVQDFSLLRTPRAYYTRRVD